MTCTLEESGPGKPPHVVICGSMSALAEMEGLAEQLRAAGFRVTTPEPEEKGTDWSTLSLDQAVALKKRFLDGYFEVIADCDIVLIANYPKHGVTGYVGANSLMEAACAHAYGKPVHFLYALLAINPAGWKHWLFRLPI